MTSLEHADDTPPSRRTLRRRLWASPHRTPLTVIALAVVVVNLPALLDVVTRDPVQLFAGLQTGAVHHALPGQSIIDPNAGFVTQAAGHLVASDWLHGHIPWWNPYEGLGSPLAGEMQSAAFFPPVLLLENALGFVLFHVLLELVAGGATYFLLRRVGLGRAAATAAGVAFGLCGTLAWFEHATANPVAFLPLALLGVERARDAALASRRHGWRLLAVALGLSVAAGFPEVAYIDGILVLLWAAVRLWSAHGRRAAMVAKLAWGVVVAVLLSAPALVAFLDYLPHADVGSHAGLFGDGFLPLQNLAQTVLPYGFGPVFGFTRGASAPLLIDIWGTAGGYLDASLAVCAVIGLFGARWRGMRIALALWVLITMSKTFGVADVSHVLNHLPAFHSIAFYRYSQTSWELAVIVLAAFGLDDLVHRRVPRILVAGAGGSVLGTIAWAGYEAWPVMRSAFGSVDGPAFTVGSIVLAASVVLLVVIGALLSTARRPGPARRVGSLLVAGTVIVEAAVLFAAPLLSAPRPAKTDVALVGYLQHHLGLARFATLGPISPNFGSFFGLAEINANDVPEPKAYAAYVRSSLDDNTDPLTFTGTLKSDANGAGPAQQLATHLTGYEAAGVRFVVVPAAGTDVFGSPWPPAGLVPAPRRVYADAVAQVWRLAAATPFFHTSGAPCHLRSEGIDAVTVTCPRPAVLHRLELPMPGWSAQVGSSTLAVASDGPFQSIPVGAGTTQVEFSFTPPYGDAALVAALAGLACLGGSLLLRQSRSPRRRPRHRRTKATGRGRHRHASPGPGPGTTMGDQKSGDGSRRGAHAPNRREADGS